MSGHPRGADTFTPACDGPPLVPIAGPVVVRGTKVGDVGASDLIGLTPF
jgi:hypothetical protein